MKLDLQKTYYLSVNEKDGAVIEDDTGNDPMVFGNKLEADDYFGFTAVPIKFVLVDENDCNKFAGVLEKTEGKD